MSLTGFLTIAEKLTVNVTRILLKSCSTKYLHGVAIMNNVEVRNNLKSDLYDNHVIIDTNNTIPQSTMIPMFTFIFRSIYVT